MASVYITGGATGIGAAAVRKFAAAGYDIAVFDINAAAVALLAAEGHSGSIHFFATDVRNRNAAALAMEKDMEAELQTIRARYENKLEVMRKAYEIAQSQLKH